MPIRLWLIAAWLLCSGCVNKNPAPSPEVETKPPSKQVKSLYEDSELSQEDALALPLGDAPVASWTREGREKPIVLVLGDSLAATDFGRALERLLIAEFALDVRRRGRSASGLARPDYFDWMYEGDRQISIHDPDLVIVILGGNDGQDLLEKKGRRRVRWRSPKWEDEYGDRVQRFVDLLTKRQPRRVLWLGLPTMARSGLEQKLVTIRAIQEHVVSNHPYGEYIETSQWFLARNGRVRHSVWFREREHPLRQDDGIHFSRLGAIWFAQRVAPMVAGSLVDG